MIYQWKTGSRITANAQAAGEMCQNLEQAGCLSAKTLVDMNRPEDAPLHGAFEWDDSIAAESWREQQARHIIGSLVIQSEKSEPVRGFFAIENAGNAYQSIHTILQRSNDTEKLYSVILKELQAIQKKYNSVQEFANVWAAINELVR